MPNISDLIEEFIVSNLSDGFLEISRNDLADFFSCAPSQINYVLSTRFSPQKGYIIESQRGGGGSIKLTQVSLDKNQYIKNLITKLIGEEITFGAATGVLVELNKRSIITDQQAELIKAAISSKSLSNPIKMENKLRANILKNVLICLLKEGEYAV